MNSQKSSLRYALYPILIFVVVTLIAACGTETQTGTEKLFESGNIAPGASYSYTFQDEGTFEYYCEIHAPNMQGSVDVTTGANSTNPDTVEMINEQFSPGQITIAPGTELVWINRGSESHTVISGTPSTNNGDNY